MKTKVSSLAIHGGSKVRTTPFPLRRAFCSKEAIEVRKAADFYLKNKVEIEYQGKFETKYCQTFSKMMGGGYCDLLSSGTNSIFVAIQSLELKKNSHILVSPIADPGVIGAIILASYLLYSVKLFGEL